MEAFVATTRVSAFSATSFTVYEGPVSDDDEGSRWQYLDPMEMERPHYRQMCAMMGVKSLAERWVQIKRYLTEGAWKPTYPAPDQIYRIQMNFARISNAFDQKLYKRGRRRTARDSKHGSSKNKLARHNMP